MRAKTIVSLIAGACAALSASAAGAAEGKRHLFVGVSVVDPVAEVVRPGSYILVDDGRIVEVGQGRPRSARGAVVHNFSGLYALPGLIDAHAHVTLGPVRVVKEGGSTYMEAVPRPDVTAHNARRLLSFGVTTIRNPAGDMAANRAYSARVAADPGFGPEALHAAEVINRLPLEFRNLVTRPSADLPIREIVRRQVAGGADFIKLYENLTEADLAEGVAAARAHGRPTIAHLSDVSWIRAARLGVDALTHLMPTSPELLPADRREAYLAQLKPGTYKFYQWWEAVDLDGPEMRELVATLAAEQVKLDATLIAFKPAFWGDDPAERDLHLEHAHPAMIENWRTLRFDLGWTEDDYRRAKAIWPKMLELTRRLYEAGVPMTIGTDLSNPFVAPGASMAREMLLHRQAGIPAWAVLRMATSEGARLLGIADQTGRLQRGLEADVVFLGANPAADLSAVSDVRAVLTDGVLVFPRDLRSPAG